MASERESFDLSGPLHLTYVLWDNPYHRMSVAACLVQAVYILERDRQENREGSDALAPPWWTLPRLSNGIAYRENHGQEWQFY